MDFKIQFLSFFVIEIGNDGDESIKKHKHFKTLDNTEYEQSTLKYFLDGELGKIAKRKVERHPKSEQASTQIGRFIVEPGHELHTNPNFNIFNRAIRANDKKEFEKVSGEFVSAYVDTSAVRGGAFLVLSARLRKYFDDPFIFIIKCDFQPNVATISDETTLINQVEMAITTRNMKSIQYPHMIEAGMVEESEVKIHQASHARYFQDFLKYVQYEESLPTIVKTQVATMMTDHFHEKFEHDHDKLVKFEEDMQMWEASPKRDIQEKLTPAEVIEASYEITQHTPEAELIMTLDDISIEGLLSDFGDSIHLAKTNGRYMLMIEADEVTFEKGVSPIEFLKPADIQDIINKINE